MAEVGSNLWSSSGPTTLLKQGHFMLVARTMPRWPLKIPKAGESTTLITHTVKKSYLMCRGKFKHLGLCSLSVTGHHQKESGSFFFLLSFQILKHIDEISPWTFSEKEYQLSWTSYERCSRPLIIFGALLDSPSSSISLLYWEAQSSPQHSRCDLTSTE